MNCESELTEESRGKHGLLPSLEHDNITEGNKSKVINFTRRSFHQKNIPFCAEKFKQLPFLGLRDATELNFTIKHTRNTLYSTIVPFISVDKFPN